MIDYEELEEHQKKVIDLGVRIEAFGSDLADYDSRLQAFGNDLEEFGADLEGFRAQYEVSQT